MASAIASYDVKILHVMEPPYASGGDSAQIQASYGIGRAECERLHALYPSVSRSVCSTMPPDFVEEEQHQEHWKIRRHGPSSLLCYVNTTSTG